MARSLEELRKDMAEYLEHEAEADLLSLNLVASVPVYGKTDYIFSAALDDPDDPEVWAIGGASPLAFYSKEFHESSSDAYSHHVDTIKQRLYAEYLNDIDLWMNRKPYDAFICHASEDKDDLVRPLANELVNVGASVWYDEFALQVGDSLRRSIDRGLASSRFGIVVLSPSFFAKNWPQYELDGLVTLENEGQKVILPIWHGVTKKDVVSYSPSLADKIALVSSRLSISDMARALVSAMV